MNEKTSALYSEYVIDGVPQELTPAQILDACLAEGSVRTGVADSFEPVVDETVDPAPKPCATDPSRIGEYIKLVRGIRTWAFPSAFPETYTKCRIACALIDAIWRRGHFRLGDLALRLDWTWSPQRIGDMSAFYASVSSAADYIDSLGLKISGYSYTEVESGCDVSAVPSLAALRPGDDDTAAAGEPEFFAELPFRTGHPQLRAQNFHPSKFLPDPTSWLIYVPFEDCEYRLGASLLAQALGSSGAMAPQIVDPDYFIDCYEVVRELVEDGVVLSGVTVGRGGLISALKRMTGPKIGASVELADLVRATGEKDIVRLLFAEVPGVLFQIADIDYDYVDAELLLQDIAFYPLGHPVPGKPGVDIISSDKPGIQTILESLIRSQSSEGED
jgi:Phosphoribosylformylglycinamidine (FGAM) synthase, synthetase domain